MSWGGLNPALTSWRNGIVARFPHRGTQSDGGFADQSHSATSQHQADADGTVDAFDCDVNFEASRIPSGNARERAIAAAVKADFEADPRAQLWIHNRTIANADIGNWRERDYDGTNPHDKHIHFETKQSRERDGRPWAMPRTDALIGWDDMPTVGEIWAAEFGRGENRRTAGEMLVEAHAHAGALRAELARVEAELAEIKAAVVPVEVPAE